jgi:hypothetical protein
MSSTIDRDDELLVIEVPHQRDPRAISFANVGVFEEWLDEHYGSKGEFIDWLCDQHDIVDGEDITTLQALQIDPDEMRAYWAHDLAATYVFDNRDEAQAMLQRLQPTSAPPRVHGAIGIANAIREWLKPAFETLEELRAEMQTQPDSVLLSEDCEDWPTFGGEMPAEAAIVSVWSWDEERVLIGEGDNLEIITREELRAEYGDAR